MDGLLFDADLRIIREVILDIHLHLLSHEGVALDDVVEVRSYPHALAQCRKFLGGSLPNAAAVASASTADAAREVAESPRRDVAAISSAIAGSTYGLATLATAIEDHPDNQTRFVLVAPRGVPGPTGHDRTAIVCFQDADRPGSLYGILGQFAARGINLTKLESRPTKQGLGEYCFIVEFDGHIADPVIADCVAELAATVARVKFLGSYPVAGLDAATSRAEVATARTDAHRWVEGLLAEELEL
jgi:prephenate dehydratase